MYSKLPSWSRLLYSLSSSLLSSDIMGFIRNSLSTDVISPEEKYLVAKFIIVFHKLAKSETKI